VSAEPTEIMSQAGSPTGKLVAGRYRLVTALGQGGSAEVWKAYEERRDRPVTLKILRDRSDRAARERFLDEAHRLETISHPSIVPVLGLQDTTEATFIVFDHVEGETLQQFAARRGRLRPRDVARLILELANGLEALHSHGFVHLDLKPANVLIGADRRLRLIDFGSAEPIGFPPETVRGTPRYAPPEVRAGGAASRASDVYGLAIIARELLGGEPESASTGRVLRGALSDDPAGRPKRARSFALSLGFAILVDEEVDAVKRGLGRARAVIASTFGGLPVTLTGPRAMLFARSSRELGRRHLTSLLDRLGPVAKQLDPVLARLEPLLVQARPLLARLPFRPSGPVIFTAAAGLFVVVLVLLAPGSQVRGTGAKGTGVQGTPAASTPSPLASASFAVPPLSSYSAAFVSQAPYPTVAPNGQVEWVVALRNTGSAGWYRGVSGAQASLRLHDGTTAAVQTTPYVGPGQTGWFIVRFQAPGQPGTHTVTLRPSIDGGGLLRDLGIHVVVTVRR
jgi:serine/threonine-protein kinase